MIALPFSVSRSHDATGAWPQSRGKTMRIYFLLASLSVMIGLTCALAQPAVWSKNSAALENKQRTGCRLVSR